MRDFRSHRPQPASPALSGAPRKAGRRPDSEQLARAAEQKRREHEGPAAMPEEIGGPEGPEPTRYGDWERKGLCVDF